MSWHDLTCVAAVFWAQLMPRPLPLSAATGGLTAALVNTLFQEPSFPPVFCQDILEDRWHWPSLLLGIFLGFIGAQLFDLLVLLRQYLSTVLRQRAWQWANSCAARQRLA